MSKRNKKQQDSKGEVRMPIKVLRANPATRTLGDGVFNAICQSPMRKHLSNDEIGDTYVVLTLTDILFNAEMIRERVTKNTVVDALD